MDNSIADWGVELAFVRTKVGAEFEVARSLQEDRANAVSRFFSAYGYFDLAALRCIDKLNTSYLVLLHRDIVESAPFRFFADQNNHSKLKFEQDLDSWLGAILVLAKINTAFGGGDVAARRWIVSRIMREKFPSAHVFFGLGYSELLLVAGGMDLAALLTAVTDMRKSRDPENATLPLFVKTTTFPLVSCAKVHTAKAYAMLEGKVLPIITASCKPAAERHIATELSGQGMFTRNIYGKSDLIIGWTNPIGIAEMASFLTGFRQKWGAAGALTKTTTYLESAIEPVDSSDIASAASPRPFPLMVDSLPGVMTEVEANQLFQKLQMVQPHALRVALSDLTLRLSACLNDLQIGEHYLDMANTFAYLSRLVENLRGASSTDGAHYTAEAVADLARAAINQRYAGLEFHPETLAHSHVPLLCDIRTIVAAATCIPHFIFDHLHPGMRASRIWPGFVLFGGTSAPQYLHQDILALPPSSLFSPIEEWWKITHETAHGIFRTLQVYDKLPEDIRHYVEKALQKFGLDDYFFIDEQFANWFDWKYVFDRDTEFYLHRIWASWIRVPRVHKSKSQYLARSFAIFLSPRLSDFFSLLQDRWKAGGQPWLNTRWEEFTAILLTVPEMADYLAELTSEEKRNALDIAFYSSPVLDSFESKFEQACGVPGLTERLNPVYPQLDEHIRLLKEGKLIADQIINPCRLHLQLLKSLQNEPPSLASEIAYLFSLENTYLRTRQ